MKRNLIFCGLLLAFIATGCAPVPLIVGGGAAGVYKTAVDERSVGGLWSDSAITGRVNAQMAKDPVVQARLIDVDTLDGEVILTGVVKSNEHSARAAAIAKKVPGVRKVRNELQIGDKTIGQSIDDTLLGARIKTHLFKEPWVRTFNIDVDVDNGIVTLTGIVDRSSRKDRVLEVARSVPGTVRVIDNLKVKGR